MKPDHSRFTLIITICLLFIVLLGFGPRFYLRAFFDQPRHLQMDRLPTSLILHGISMTLWYIMLVIQSTLINVNKTKVHMMVGRGLALLALFIPVFAIPVIMGFAPRMVELGFLDIHNAERMEFQTAMWTNDVLALIVFCGMVATGLLNRKNKVIHRSMILYASMAFMGPAIFRMLEWMAPQYVMEGMFLLFFLFPIAVLVNDWIQQKRLPVYSFSGFVIMVLLMALTFLLPTTSFWQGLFIAHL